jgi:hypothetical protein
MIRIGYMSDLHLEFEHNREWFGAAEFQRLKTAREALPGHPQIGPLLSDLDVDVMVIAGDIWLGTRGIGYCADVSQFLGVPVVTVAGTTSSTGIPSTRYGSNWRPRQQRQASIFSTIAGLTLKLAASGWPCWEAPSGRAAQRQPTMITSTCNPGRWHRRTPRLCTKRPSHGLRPTSLVRSGKWMRWWW